MSEVQRNAIGVKIKINVVDEEGNPVNLTGATNLKIKMRPDVGSDGLTKTATLEGTDAVYCLTTATSDLDTLGIWKAQVYYELGSYKGDTRPVEIFSVVDNLD